MLVGGIAMLSYVEGRYMEDINLIVSLQSLKNLPEITLSPAKATICPVSFVNCKSTSCLPPIDCSTGFASSTPPYGSFVERAVRLPQWRLFAAEAVRSASLYRQGNFARVGL